MSDFPEQGFLFCIHAGWSLPTNHPQHYKHSLHSFIAFASKRSIAGHTVYSRVISVYQPAPRLQSVAEAITCGTKLRRKYKSKPWTPVIRPPMPASPKGPKLTDVKMTRLGMRKYARCMRVHNVVLSDRMEVLAKPPRRTLIYRWREFADKLPADTIARYRSMLDADEPFKPDQAYQYFVNLRVKKKKKNGKMNQAKKDIIAMSGGDRRIVWARNATVAFARGIKKRLARPGVYNLCDSMLRLSNIVLQQISRYMGVRPPTRRCKRPKSRFIREMADKIAVWIDDIMMESEDRMLMMDFDEDDEIMRADAGDAGGDFADDFLNMIGGGGLKQTKAAYLNFSPEMLEAFMILTDAMYKRGKDQLLQYGKCTLTYSEGANELKGAPSLDADEFSSVLAEQLRKDLAATAQPTTPNHLASSMKEVVSICSNYLAQYAEHNKDKGPAFRLLVKTMKSKSSEPLYEYGKSKHTMGTAAKRLEEARGLESDHDDPNLSQSIHAELSGLVENVTPAELKEDMTETLDICSKYLSQCAVDDNERGPAFDLMIKTLEKYGADDFTPEHKPLNDKFVAAYVLKNAPGLTVSDPVATTAPVFNNALKQAVANVTPPNLESDMKEVVDRCGDYLSTFVRDRDPAVQGVVKMMKSNPPKVMATRNNYTLDYGTGAREIETTSQLVPVLPLKDISDEMKRGLTGDMADITPPKLEKANKSVIKDASGYDSQVSALRSGVGGPRYPLTLESNLMKSLPNRPLVKHKSYGVTYNDAGNELQKAGVLESDPKTEPLAQKIVNEIETKGFPRRVSHGLINEMHDTTVGASRHIAKQAHEKGEALDKLLELMRTKGREPLATLQGYQQSYQDGVTRIENTDSLANDKVDRGGYETVRTKLTALAETKRANDNVMPGVIDEVSTFLAAPPPETNQEKKNVLGDIIARKGKEIIGEHRVYKMTHTEAGKDVRFSPAGVTTSKDEALKKHVVGKIDEALKTTGEPRIISTLKDVKQEGGAYLADEIKERGDAMQVIHDGLKSEKDKALVNVGKIQTSYEQGADLIKKAPHFVPGGTPDPVVLDQVASGVDSIAQKSNVSDKKHMADASNIAKNYLADVAGKEGYAQGGSSATAGSVPDPSSKAADSVGAPAPTPLPSGAGGGSVSAPAPTPLPSGAGGGSVGPPAPTPLPSGAGGGSVGAPAPTPLPSGAGGGSVGAPAPTPLPTPLPIGAGGGTGGGTGGGPGRTVSIKEFNEKKVLTPVQDHALDATVGPVLPLPSRKSSDSDIDRATGYPTSEADKASAAEGLIAEMQKRGNEMLIQLDEGDETYFFAAQRLKKAATLKVANPRMKVAEKLAENLKKVSRCRTMPVEHIGPMKEHVKVAADYLSTVVAKEEDKSIEAYCALLDKMEAAGDKLLVEGPVPKTYKEAAAYLRQLTTTRDVIGRVDGTMQSLVENRLKQLGAQPAMDSVISENTRLLVSFVKLQEAKTKLLEGIIRNLEQAGDEVLLRHGAIRKTFLDGANALRGKNAAQLKVKNADPMAARKIFLKLYPMRNKLPIDALMNDVLNDVISHLAVVLLEPHARRVCKCTKNVYVQCDPYCEKMLKVIPRPCCSCEQKISKQVIDDITTPAERAELGENLTFDFIQCPDKQKICPDSCTNDATQPTTSYVLYSTLTRSPFRPVPVNNATSDESVFVTEKKSFSSQITDVSYVSSRSNTDLRSERDIEMDYSVQETGEVINQDRHKNSRTNVGTKRKIVHDNHGYVLGAPIVCTSEMGDWHAMMISLMWNVDAWRDWIQRQMEHALRKFQSSEESKEDWVSFNRTVTTEALQWRQYSSFIQQLTLRLALRYRDKQIVSPTCATDRTQEYLLCQKEMLRIIELFDKWTRWISILVKESDSLKHSSDTNIPLHEQRWAYFNARAQKGHENWLRYNLHLKVCWEDKYRHLITEWMGADYNVNSGTSFWVVGACGSVPCGAVSAGVGADGEMTWVARSTWRGQPLPGALSPALHCCLLHADGAVRRITKYQVLCNSEARWVSWRAGCGGARGVSVARGVLVGRVRYLGGYLVGPVLAPKYHCHVVLYGRNVAFSCYELLVLQPA